VVGVYYRLINQGEPADQVFLLHLQETWYLQSLILLGEFSHPDICWKSSMVSCGQSRKFLKCIEDNFLSQVIDWIKTGGSPGCSDHALVEFAVLKEKGQVKSKVRTLNFRKEKFQLFKELVNRTPWETTIKDRGEEQSW